MTRQVDPELARARGGALNYVLLAKNNAISLLDATTDLRARARATIGNHPRLPPVENPLISAISLVGNTQRLIDRAISEIHAIDVTVETPGE